MTEEQIKEILESDNYIECIKKIAKIYPNGFDINKIDKRIKHKLENKNKVIDIQIPDKGIPTELRRKLMKYKN